jgi:hypothetical protein
MVILKNALSWSFFHHNWLYVGAVVVTTTTLHYHKCLINTGVWRDNVRLNPIRDVREGDMM